MCRVLEVFTKKLTRIESNKTSQKRGKSLFFSFECFASERFYGDLCSRKQRPATANVAPGKYTSQKQEGGATRPDTRKNMMIMDERPHENYGGYGQ